MEVQRGESQPGQGEKSIPKEKCSVLDYQSPRMVKKACTWSEEGCLGWGIRAP